ncbi:MAG: 50S ribosomal subunit protein L33 [Candidatus Westeberhardia cardiocondylae]|nr:50S ribosomal subunit protein L33 [Candidatus Westeberhardia cardiocondylae]
MAREKIMLLSSASSHFYTITKSKKLKLKKMVFRKFDPFVRRHVLYNEVKIKK